MGEKLKFHRIPEVKLPKHFSSNSNVIRIVSIKHLDLMPNKGNIYLFKTKGYMCANPKCKRKGHYIVVYLINGGGLGISVLSKDLVFMTKDHIVPTSKGGADKMCNLQPMCSICNTIKGNSYSIIPEVNLQITKFEKKYGCTTKKTQKLLSVP